jgi:hypothetical protein
MSYELQFLTALAKTLLVEVPIVLVLWRCVFKKHDAKNTCMVACIATMLTLPYLWFVLPTFLPYRNTYLVLGELTVTLVEAVLYWKLLHISFIRGIMLSIVANGISLLIGML